jgi:pyruvate dehydrogenase E1 component subunit alpha
MSVATSVPREQLVAFLREMLLIRRFEEKVTKRFRAGEFAGFLHAAIGQEAVAVGVCRALEDGDVIASTHRAHGHVLANVTPANEVMAELYGKVEGCSHGYGGDSSGVRGRCKCQQCAHHAECPVVIVRSRADTN